MEHSTKLKSAILMDEGLLGFRPLYRQVRDILVKRIADGIWRPGQVLPSEVEIASDLRVSQGTVRKALDEMAAENLVVRRQGRGTFVAKHDDTRLQFQFFKLSPDRGDRQLPSSRVITAQIRTDSIAAEQLKLLRDEPILQIERVRILNDDPCIVERISLPSALFRGLAVSELPTNLYEHYASAFGVRIAWATEKLKAVKANEQEAGLMGVALGAPLLQIDRLAFSLDSRCVEWRISLCCTDEIHYTTDLR
jgi:GntR family transcriptional regulator